MSDDARGYDFWMWSIKGACHHGSDDHLPLPKVGIYPWDVCAGAVIVEEAGGVCLDTMGGDFDLASRGSAELDRMESDG